MAIKIIKIPIFFLSDILTFIGIYQDNNGLLAQKDNNRPNSFPVLVTLPGGVGLGIQ